MTIYSERIKKITRLFIIPIMFVAAVFLTGFNLTGKTFAYVTVESDTCVNIFCDAEAFDARIRARTGEDANINDNDNDNSGETETDVQDNGSDNTNPDTNASANQTTDETNEAETVQDNNSSENGAAAYHTTNDKIPITGSGYFVSAGVLLIIAGISFAVAVIIGKKYKRKD